jgi:hypothetical protein
MEETSKKLKWNIIIAIKLHYIYIFTIYGIFNAKCEDSVKNCNSYTYLQCNVAIIFDFV